MDHQLGSLPIALAAIGYVLYRRLQARQHAVVDWRSRVLAGGRRVSFEG